MPGPLHPHKFKNKELRDAIIDDIYHKIPYQLAAESNGIVESTLYAWLEKGEQDTEAGIESDYAQFSEAIKKAEKKRMREHIDTMEEKGENWTVDAWFLERRWWKHFGRNAGQMELAERVDKLEKGK